jgi:UDP-MurNAc hydroxylase
MMEKLTFEFIGNACGIFTGKNGTKVLCDPWIVNGVFDGSWCHYPELKTTISNLMNVDAIYISHLHPDHFDERNFNFDYEMPLIVLDHGPNFLIKKLKSLGYNNLIKIKDSETIDYKEFQITMFAPFAKHNFHDAKIGNLIDSAMLISCDGVSALNANDNTPSIEASKMLLNDYGDISLAMLNYNAAGPYPCCFDNLTDEEKSSEHERVLERNLDHMKRILSAMKPKYVLPFAGAYVLGGDLRFKNKYLGTTTWDECANWLNNQNIAPTSVVLLRENDTLNIENGLSDRPYQEIDKLKMRDYIENELCKVRYPYQDEETPREDVLIDDMQKASIAMKERMHRYKLSSSFNIVVFAFGRGYSIYPTFNEVDLKENLDGNKLECRMDERLLRRILDRKSHWNNAEIGAHINFIRSPNVYEPDLHTILQFFHL